MKSEDANGKTSVRYTFLLLFILCMNGPWNKLQAQSGDIFFESLSPDIGLSQITVSCIFQDSKGLMWFGTQYGLNRFDGYSIDVFENESDVKTSISNSSINGIIEDHKGYLWIATENGLNRYCYETDEFLRFYKAQDNKGISGNKVSSIYRDRKGRIWIGTEQGLNFLNYDSLTFSKQTFNNFLINNRIFSIHDDSFGNLWIGTLKGLVRYTVDSGIWRIFTNNPNVSGSLSNNHVRSILEDSNKSIWIGTRDGLNLYDPRQESFFQFGKSICPDKELTHSAVKCMVEDSEKNLLIGTNEGLNVYNLDTKELVKHNQKKRGAGNLNHFFIYSLFIDNARTVWVGTFSGGVNFYNSFVRKFRFYNPGNNIVFGNIGPLVEQKNELWIGTGGGGLLNYDLNFNFKNQYLLNSIGKTYDQNIVRSLIGDGNFLYAGTNEKLLQFDPDSKRVITKENDFKGYISSFLKDKNECIWLCQNDTFGLHFINKETGKKEQAYYYGENGAKRTLPYATCIKEDSEGVFWVGTRYAGLFLYDSKKKTAQRFNARTDSLSLKTNHITALHIDSHNNLWVGTFNGGLSLLNRSTNKFTTYSQANGLSNNLFGILEDNAGFLWIESFLGISKFDPVKTVFVNYYKENGFPLQEMSENSFVKLRDGRFFAGGNNGFIVFDPMKLKTNGLIPPVLISDFKLLGSTGNEKGAVKRKFINAGEKIKLKYNQSSFIIEYTALNYIFPGKNQYAYKLEGFDTDWNFVGKQRIAIYTNLNAGNYIFKVKACNNDGIWNEKGMSLPIKILPPPWKTWWAYLIYFIILAGFFFRLIHYLKLENEVKIKQIEHDNMEKVHHLRIRLFTNFSHELRTPLTLILGPLDDLLERSDVSASVRNSLFMIQKNARRLLVLVNQLMDFRKQESGSMKLKAVERKINKFVKEVSMAFNELAVRHRINYILNGCDEDIVLWFDPAQLEKVLFNLLSNAFKNTAPDGKIVISLIKRQLAEIKDLPEGKRLLLNNSKTEEFVELSISNTGKGIQEKELNKIFDPFYQIAEDGQSSVGTGIGLSLVKGIAEIHHGVVWAESSPGEGAIFRILLPAGNQHLTHDEIVKNYLGSEHSDHYLVSDETDESILQESNEEVEKRYTILVIDDNADIRLYIKSKLKNEFSILEAANGREGLEIAIRQIPDLIISDIMMPDIDGLQLCIKLKNDIHTSHIPIILLTARTTFEQVKEGFDVGADDYITKPFNGNILRLKVNSVIKNRERLRQTFGKKLPFELSGLETKSIDAEFLKKIYHIIERNLSNPEFDIESFSEEVGMSRANLYRKIKNLTGLAPNELIKNYRLQVGLKYLRETDLSISEISYKTGFNNPAYFTNCFKKVHKLSPTEYLEKMKVNG